jgi:drug/metabolite transporter (DMT)-like permease
MMFNRMAAGDAPAMVMQFLVAAVAAPLLVVAAIALNAAGVEIGWPSAIVVLKCLGVACFATAGHSLIFAAVERASASTVAPMTYVQLLVAAFLGWLWFGDRPDAATFGGAVLIICGGLLLWRAQRAKDPAGGPG